MDENKRLGIPLKIKAELWVAAAGRCEFNCCNKRLDINILTKSKLFMAQHAHIIGDSVNGPRGEKGLSKELSQDLSNLMLTCRECHWEIDRLDRDYDEHLLRRMKKRHEDRIQRLYDLDETKDSVAVVLRHPIKQIHVPAFTPKEVHTAILLNSDFCHAPSEHTISLDYRSRATREQDASYWQELVRQMKDEYDRQMHLSSTDGHKPHLSIFAFAPMPLLMQLGAFIGNKVEASTMQWDRTAESWKFPRQRQLPPQDIEFEDIPNDSGKALAVRLCFSGEVSPEKVAAAVPGIPVIRFGVASPTPMLIESPDDIRHFRLRLTALLAEIANKHYEEVHLFPAMPLSLAVELGRQLLPKVHPKMRVWDQDNGTFTELLTIQV